MTAPLLLLHSSSQQQQELQEAVPVTEASSLASSPVPMSNTIEMGHKRSRGRPHKPRRQHHSSTPSGYAHVVVQHNYLDHMHESPRLDPESGKHEADLMELPCTATSPFPIKLYEMLREVEENGEDHLIHWQPHGRCFIIPNAHEFVAQLLPRYFKQKKLASFQRQLNLYGFQRITKGRDRGSYYHEHFLKSRKHLAFRIHRVKVKGTGVRGKANPATEPKFYSMEFVGSDNDTSPSAMDASVEQEQDEQAIVTTTTMPLPVAPTLSYHQPTQSIVSHDEEDGIDSQETVISSRPVRSIPAASRGVALPALISPIPQSISFPAAHEEAVQEAVGQPPLSLSLTQKTEPPMDATQKCLWGMPFQVLESWSLPLDDKKHLSREQSERHRPPTSTGEHEPELSTTGVFMDLDDQAYLENILESMVQDFQTSAERVHI